MQSNRRVVIITGGAAGIGKGIAECFAQEQANIVIADWNKTDGLATQRFLETFGVEVVFIHMDVSVKEEVEKVIAETLQRWGRIDVLVNNVGNPHFNKPMLDISMEEWDHLMKVDLRGGFLMSKSVLPQMIQQKKGSIVNISSVHANVSDMGYTAYSAAKGGVMAMTRSMAAEFASSGIRVNAVLPGWTRTKHSDEYLSQCSDQEKEAELARWGRKIPIGRVADPIEIGYAVAFLASDKASYCTGSCLTVDGGITSTLKLNSDF